RPGRLSATSLTPLAAHSRSPTPATSTPQRSTTTPDPAKARLGPKNPPAGTGRVTLKALVEGSPRSKKAAAKPPCRSKTSKVTSLPTPPSPKRRPNCSPPNDPTSTACLPQPNQSTTDGSAATSRPPNYPPALPQWAPAAT